LDATLAVAADYANVATDGKLNIMGIFQEFFPASFPAAGQPMFLVFSFSAGPAEVGSQKDVRIAFVGPEGDQNLVLDLQVTVPEPPRAGTPSIIHQILGVQGLPLFRPGHHAFYILVGGEEKARIPIYVNEPPVQEAEQTGGVG
jgi:hypothetical protein